MRRIGTLPTAERTERFGRYLAAQGIENRFDQRNGDWEIWVYDEDQVAAARQTLAEFKDAPEDTRFDVREPPAAAPPVQRRRDERERPARTVPMAGSREIPVTISLAAISVAVTLATNFGQAHPEIVNQLLITQFDKIQVGGNVLKEVSRGEIWRLFTPMFLHFSVLHLAFNMYMFWVLGGLVEQNRGSFRFLLLVLLISGTADMAQFLVSHGNFGGLSGVIYGLFGYMWMKAIFSPREGFQMPNFIVLQMVFWLFLGLTGKMGPIANGAHFGGLVAGMLLGAVPALWQRSP